MTFPAKEKKLAFEQKKKKKEKKLAITLKIVMMYTENICISTRTGN